MADLFSFLGAALGGSQTFIQQYKCHSLAMLGDHFQEYSDKVVLPPSALDRLSRMQVQYPMLFELRHDALGLTTHVGTLEFTAAEGFVHVPRWLMASLHIPEGGVVTLTNKALPKASWVKLQPQSKEFLDLSDPKAALEVVLAQFSCLTQGRTITFQHAAREYQLLVQELKPADACCIIETDMEVDFSAPPGYEEEMAAQAAKAAAAKQEAEAAAAAAAEAEAASSAFTGTGHRLVSDKRTTNSTTNANSGTPSPMLTAALGGTLLGGSVVGRPASSASPATAPKQSSEAEEPSGGSAFKLGGVKNPGRRLGGTPARRTNFAGTGGGRRVDGAPAPAPVPASLAAAAAAPSAPKRPALDLGDSPPPSSAPAPPAGPGHVLGGNDVRPTVQPPPVPGQSVPATASPAGATPGGTGGGHRLGGGDSPSRPPSAGGHRNKFLERFRARQEAAQSSAAFSGTGRTLQD